MADAIYNSARHVAEPGHLRRIPGTVAERITSGDFLVLVSSKGSPATALGDSGTTAQNQEAAHDVFLGVAVDSKAADVAADVLYATRGLFRYPCAALGQAYEVGQPFGMAGTGAGLAVGVAAQEVVPVATNNLAIGKLAENAASGATSVLLEIAGVLSTPWGGCQAFA